MSEKKLKRPAKEINFAIGYAIAALVMGVIFREFDRFGLSALPQTMGRIHGHLLSLGTLFMLILAVLQSLGKPAGALSRQKGYTIAFWLYQSGLILMCVMLFVRGMTGLLDGPVNFVISGIAGVGHILLAVGLIWILFDVRKALIEVQKSNEPSPYEWQHHSSSDLPQR